MFCKYCGKEIPNGSTCDCQDAASHSSAAQAPNVAADGQTAVQPINVSVNAQNIFAGLRELAILAFTNPVGMLSYAYSKDDKSAQYAAGIIYAIVLFVLPFIEFKTVFGSMVDEVTDSMGKISFGIMLTALLCKLAVALVLFIVNKQPFSKLLAVVSATTIFALAIRLVLSITIMLKLGGIAAAVFVIGLIINTAFDYETVNLSFGGNNRNKMFWFFIIIEAIVCAITYVVCYNTVFDVMRDMGSIF